RLKWLVDQQIRGGFNAGMWDYGLTSRGNGDNSNSQFALLGLYEGERALKRLKRESPVPRETWQRAVDNFAQAQNENGSWGYVKKGDHGYGSMTCAGIASIIIASGQLQGSSATLAGETVKCCGSDRGNEYARRVRDGLGWLGHNATLSANPQYGQTGYYYYLYALERVGRLTAQRFIGTEKVKSDWYRDGIRELIGTTRHLRFRGWSGKGHGEENEHVATSFALLFLAKGNRPVLIGKLKYGTGGIG